MFITFIIITVLIGTIIRAYDDEHRLMATYDRPMIYSRPVSIVIMFSHMFLLGISVILTFYEFGWLYGIGSIVLIYTIIPRIFDNTINKSIYMLCEAIDNFNETNIVLSLCPVARVRGNARAHRAVRRLQLA